jgi:hypothetical protein
MHVDAAHLCERRTEVGQEPHRMGEPVHPRARRLPEHLQVARRRTVERGEHGLV